MTLIEFLLARIAEDEAEAQMAADGWVSGDGMLELGCWDAKRVLAECEAKRQIIERHDDQHDDGDPRSYAWPYVGCVDLRLLVQPHTDHPDYQKEWAL